MSQAEREAVTEEVEESTMRGPAPAVKAFSGAGGPGADAAEGGTARVPGGKIGALGPAAGAGGRGPVIPAGAGRPSVVPAGRDFVSARADATVGRVIELPSGAYTVTSVISQNLTGEADIYLVERAGERFVYKLYRAQTPPKLEVLERIKELQHPNVIRLLDFGETNGQFYEIMEYAAGGTIDRHAPIRDLGRYREIVKQLAGGFQYCHERGLIHQDIKPENVFCRDEDGRELMVADFGIASVLAEGFDRTETQSNLTLGYGAPEAYGSTAGGQEFEPIIGRETDYYALGITLLHLWVGQFPFKGLTKRVVIDMTRSGNVEVPDDMPPELRQLIAGLITLNYLDRWGYDEISRWLAGENVPVAQAQQFHIPTLEPYPFIKKDGETRYARSLKEMASLMTEYPADGIKRLYRGDIAEWVKPVDPLLHHQLRDIVEDEFPELDTAGRRKAIYLLDPDHGFISTFNDIVPKGQTIEETLEALGDFLESSDKQLQAVTVVPEEMLAYLDTLNEGALGRQFVRDAEELTTGKAANRLVIALQGEEQLKIAGERFASYEDLRMAGDAVKKALVEQLHEDHSKFLVWLELMGLKLDSKSIDKTDPAELAGMLREMPWIKLYDEKLRERLNKVDAEGWSDLMKLAAEGEVEACKELIDNGADPNRQSASGATALSIAATSGHADLAGYLLQAGADAECRNADGKTILHQAVDMGAEAVVRVLLEGGANANAFCTVDMWTPLRSAVNLGYEGVARLLLERGADPNLRAEGRDEMVPLHNAAADNSAPLVRLLLEHGADPTGREPAGITPLHLAARDDATETLSLLLDAGLDVNLKDMDGFTPLHYAVWDKSMNTIRMLLERGADVNVGEHDTMPEEEGAKKPIPTPLVYAASDQNVEMVGLLLQHGADPEATFNEQTPAMMATFANNMMMLRVLLDAGASAHAAYPDGFSLTHAAVQEANDEILEFLLQRGAPVDSVYVYDDDEPPIDPLVFAIHRGYRTGASLIAQYGGGRGKYYWEGQDPTRVCLWQKDPETLELILQAGVNPDRHVDSKGLTTWHMAALEEDPRYTELLCQYARGMNRRNKYGYTPLMHAAAEGNRATAETLANYGARLGPRSRNARGAAAGLAGMNGHTTIAEDLAGRMRLKLRNGLAMVLSWPVKIACALVALYTLFYFSGQDFLMATPLLVPDTVPAFAGYLIWAFVIGHAAFAYLYASRIRTARNYASYAWLKDPGGIGSMLKVFIKPGLLGLVIYGLARLLQARDLPIIGPIIAQSEAARILDQHLLARFVPEVHAIFLQGGIIGDVVPYVSSYPVLVESGIVLVALGVLAFFVGRWRDDLARTMRRVYGS